MEESQPLFAQQPNRARFSQQRGWFTAATVRLNALRWLWGGAARLCVLLILVPLLLFLALFPIIAAIAYWDAPCDQPLAVFLLVYGLNPAFGYLRQRDNVWVQRLVFLSNVFVLVWFVQGCVWVFSSSADTCNPVLYYVSFWLVVLSLGMFGVGLCLVCCLVCLLPPSVVHGGGANGLSKDELARLRTAVFREGAYDKDDAHCVICMGDYTEGEDVTELSCEHHFHTECVKRWLEANPTCPFCRKDMHAAADHDHDNDHDADKA